MIGEAKYICIREGMRTMEDPVKTIEEADEKMVRETLFSDLDKGIDDMEAGRMHEVDEAFQIIRERVHEES